MLVCMLVNMCLHLYLHVWIRFDPDSTPQKAFIPASGRCYISVFGSFRPNDMPCSLLLTSLYSLGNDMGKHLWEVTQQCLRRFWTWTHIMDVEHENCSAFCQALRLTLVIEMM